VAATTTNYYHCHCTAKILSVVVLFLPIIIILIFLPLSPLFSPSSSYYNRGSFIDGIRRVGEATLHKLGIIQGACDDNTLNLNAELRR